MSEESSTIAAHVAFVVDRNWVADVVSALRLASCGQVPPLADTLNRWWSRRTERLNIATVPLTTDIRRELAEVLADEPSLLALVHSAPERVRVEALSRARGLALRPGALRALNAPSVIIDAQVRACEKALRELDPAAPWAPDPPFEPGMVEDPETHAEVPDLFSWFNQMLVAAQANGADVGLGEAFHASAEAQRFLAEGERDLPALSGWPGFELSTLSVQPDLAFWQSPRIALPHVLHIPAANEGGPPRLVVAEASGPVTYAFAEDANGLSAALTLSLAARVRALTATEALLSFVWLATETAGPWRPF